MMQLWQRKSTNSFWVMRDANLAAYELAKSAASPASLLIVIQTLPPSVVEAWQRDAMSILRV